MARRLEEEAENNDRWMVSYADFITLLFALFTVLYATSQQDSDKEKQFEKSIRKYFQQSPSAGAMINVGTGKDDASVETPLANPLSTQQEKQTARSEVEKEVDNAIKKELSEDERKNLVGSVRHEAVGVRISLASSAIFPSGSNKIRPEAMKGLDKLGALIKKLNRRVIIEGHTDDQPVQNENYPSNWELASMRATKMVRYLIQRHQIDPQQLVAISYADQKPVAPNDSEENRAKNRRIEVLIVSGEDGDEQIIEKNQ
jgi:chemotaxis protein MotB